MVCNGVVMKALEDAFDKYGLGKKNKEEKKEIKEKESMESVEKIPYREKAKKVLISILPKTQKIIRGMKEITDWTKSEIVNYLVIKGYECLGEEEKKAFETIKKMREELKKWE